MSDDFFVVLGKKHSWNLLNFLFLNRDDWFHFEYLEGVFSLTPKILSLRLKQFQKLNLVQHKISVKKIPVSSMYKITVHGMDVFSKCIELKRCVGGLNG